MSDLTLTSNDRFASVLPTADELKMLRAAYAETYPVRSLLNEIDRLRKSVDTLNAANQFLSEQLESERVAPETGVRLNRLRLERLALQAINSLPCPDAEPLAKALDDQFERVTGYRTKNWPHGAETMRLEREGIQATTGCVHPAMAVREP